MLHGHPPSDLHLCMCICMYVYTHPSIWQPDFDSLSWQTFKKQLRTIRFGPQRLQAINEFRMMVGKFSPYCLANKILYGLQ